MDFKQVINSKIFKTKSIVSYGLILHTIIDGEIYYLIGNVRDTIAYKEFIKGNLKDCDIIKYIEKMSHDEKYRIVTENFNELLDDLTINHNSKVYKTSKENEDLFNKNRMKYFSYLTDTTGLKHKPWIFPKGRLNNNETEIECALREFEEETQIESKYITIYNNKSFEELYYGLDYKLYKTVYFIGFIKYDDFLSMNISQKFVKSSKRVTVSNEISNIKWVDYKKAIKLLDITKKHILRLTDIYLTFNLKTYKIKEKRSRSI